MIDVISSYRRRDTLLCDECGVGRLNSQSGDGSSRCIALVLTLDFSLQLDNSLYFLPSYAGLSTRSRRGLGCVVGIIRREKGSQSGHASPGRPTGGRTNKICH